MIAGPAKHQLSTMPRQVELFGVRFAAASSQPKYLIGVKENSDFERRGDAGASHGAAALPSFAERPLERATSSRSEPSVIRQEQKVPQQRGP